MLRWSMVPAIKALRSRTTPITSGLRFKVFRSTKPDGGEAFFAAITIADEPFFVSQGYSMESSAFHVCDMAWLAMGNLGRVPYVRDSLKPAAFVDSRPPLFTTDKRKD